MQDLVSTIIELTGYTNWQTSIAANKPVDSKSLVPILKNTATEAHPWVYSEVFDVSTTSETNSRAIRNASYKLMYFDSSRVQEFYNLSTDAKETTNLLNRALTATELTNYNYLCTEMGTLLGRTICNPKVGTNDNQVLTKPTIAPNPAQSLITVSFNDALSFDFQISSIEGQLMKKGSSSKEINISDLPNGLFLLKIQKQGDVFTEKIVIEK